MNNPQLWQAIAAVIAAYAALLGGLYAIVTRPMVARMDEIVRRRSASRPNPTITRSASRVWKSAPRRSIEDRVQARSR